MTARYTGLPPVCGSEVNRPFGSGIGRPNSMAVSIHSWMTISAFANASCRVWPSAAQPANSRTSAMNASSSALQCRMIRTLSFNSFRQLMSHD